MLKVLLVDDEAPILNNLNRVLPWQEMGMEVAGMARSGMEALRIAEEEAPDLVLCDIRMPVMDGLTFVGKLREMGLESEVLLLSGYQEFDYAREAIRLGVKEYICKPIHYEELGNKVRNIGAQIRNRQYKDKLYNSIPLFQELPAAGETPKKTPEQLMNQAVKYISERLNHDLGIEEVAGKIGISSSYFCLLFKNRFAVTFVEYVTQQRIEAAKFMLASTDKSIAAISAGVGYQERRYFTKVFQKQTGMTPKEYRDRSAGPETH
ncbi:AraC family transcriptional regulator [Paenibacillus sp. FSL R7-0273]|uniref:response regulator transcription factor n=1 Tax=Paenibacillus sp. FSL R7-0273 TaxID=1536772 RepID=UPI0004F74D82|nr:response regulator [Paenibacillus sp. FSL R7-0273]AIQ48368.1 AraC family transcriptional regulator [Paenibacillus sp. FSL R7-0273]OMF88486.1 DNA-binding response regulator [Paenibacillus sp. FSL R7-0273]